MKVRIRYDYDPQYGTPYWAIADDVPTIAGGRLMAQGSELSFAHARRLLLDELSKKLNPPAAVPPTEEVDI